MAILKVLTFKRILITTILVIGLIPIGLFGWYVVNKSLALKATRNFCHRLGIKVEEKPRYIEYKFSERWMVSYKPAQFSIVYPETNFTVNATTHEVIGFSTSMSQLQEDSPLKRFIESLQIAMSKEEKIDLAEKHLQVIGGSKDAVFEKLEERDDGYLLFEWGRAFDGYKYYNWYNGDNKISLEIYTRGGCSYRYESAFWAKPCLSAEVKITRKNAIYLAMERIERIARTGVYHELDLYEIIADYEGIVGDISIKVIQPNNYWDLWRVKLSKILSVLLEDRRDLGHFLDRHIVGRKMSTESKLAWVVEVKLVKKFEPEPDREHIYYDCSPAIVYVDATNGKILGGFIRSL